jgi:hypothetical protein
MQSFDLNGVWILVLDYHVGSDESLPKGPGKLPGKTTFTTAWSADEEWSTTAPFMEFTSQPLADEYMRQHQREMENAFMSF